MTKVLNLNSCRQKWGGNLSCRVDWKTSAGLSELCSEMLTQGPGGYKLKRAALSVWSRFKQGVFNKAVILILKKAIKVKGKWGDGKLNICNTGWSFEFPNPLHNKNA